MTVLLSVSAILFGVLAYKAMPVNDLPAVDYPVIQVNCSYPGATPETMANNVATPLERQFTQIPGLEVVTSSSSQGQSSFTLQFNLNKSIDAAATDVQTAITQANGQLPTDLPSPPTFSKTNPNDQPIMYIALATTSVTRGQLYDYASTQAGERISIVPGVSKIQIYGTPSAVRIEADPSKLAVRNMTMDTLNDALKNGTSYQGSGQFDGPTRTFLLQPQGQLGDAEAYNKLVIGYQNHAPVYLRDVATAYDSVQDDRIDLRFWARAAKVNPTATVVIAVFRQAGTNAVDVAQRVEHLIPTIQKTLPNSVLMKTIYDQSKSIVNSVEDVESTLVIAFVLVVFVIFIFLGRAADTLIPAVALPLSLLLTFIAMNVLGYSLDNLSLMALTLAIGFLVDDAIVFLENAVRRMEKFGESPAIAALRGAQEISFTILSMTISLAAVFLPLLLLSGLMGRIFREFSVTIIISIFASGIVSLTLTPLMCSRMLARRGHGIKKTFLERVIGGVEHKVLDIYGASLWFFLRNKWISAITWIICLFGTVALFQMVPKSFLPVGDSSFLFGVMIAQQGTSPDQMKRYQDHASALLQANPDVIGTVTVTSVSGGLLGSNQGFLIAFLDDPSERHSAPANPMSHAPAEEHATIQTIAQQIQYGIMGTNPGLLAFMIPQPVLSISTGASSRTQGDLSFAISGVDPAEVYRTSDQLMGRFMSQAGKMFLPMGGVSNDLSNQPAYNNPNLQINILRDQAASYGISATRIETLLKNAYSQNYVYLIKRPTNQYQVILEVQGQDRTEPKDLSQLYIKSDDGTKTVPLSTVAQWVPVLGPQSVNHLNQFTSVTFSFNLLPGVPLGTATDFIAKTAADVVPSTMRADFQGQALTFRDTVSSLSVLMCLAVFVMYVILGILYESYLHPITVLSSLPVALVGGLGTLVLFHQEASLYAYIGMFMLMGIVKKNGIMIVDFALQRISEGETALQAIHDASMDRFRPIIMTTLAAVMGAVPIAMGFGADGAGRRPLGLVIIGGLIVSQFITLYVTPAIYLYLENFQEGVLDRVPFFRSARTHREDFTASDDTEEPHELVAAGNGNGGHA
jgi:hydrophobic/amphiphilic exporter-1 (mainly G- bacteria), HAE1 family